MPKSSTQRRFWPGVIEPYCLRGGRGRPRIIHGPANRATKDRRQDALRATSLTFVTTEGSNHPVSDPASGIDPAVHTRREAGRLAYEDAHPPAQKRKKLKQATLDDFGWHNSSTTTPAAAIAVDTAQATEPELVEEGREIAWHESRATRKRRQDALCASVPDAVNVITSGSGVHTGFYSSLLPNSSRENHRLATKKKVAPPPADWAPWDKAKAACYSSCR